MAFSWLINGGDPTYLLTGMILQVSLVNLHPPNVPLSPRVEKGSFKETKGE